MLIRGGILGRGHFVRLLANLSIRAKIIISSTFTLFLIVAFIMVYYPIQAKRTAYSNLRQKDQSLAEMLALGVALSMARGDSAGVEETVNWAGRDRTITYALVLDQQGGLIASYNSEGLKNNLDHLMTLHEVVESDSLAFHAVQTNVSYNNVDYGQLFLGSSLDYLHMDIRQAIQITVKVSLAILLAGIVVALLLSKMITTPLVRLKDAAVRMAQGDHNIEIPISSNDEVGALGSAFNAMADNVRLAINDLTDSKERSRLIIETAADAYVSVDESRNVIEWNGQAETLFGWQRSNAIGKPLSQLILPELTSTAHIDDLRKFCQAGEFPVLNRTVETVARRREGGEFPVELTVWPVTSSTEGCLNGFIRDISERRKAEIALRESERKYRQLYQLSPLGIAVWDTDGRYKYVNTAYCKTYGHPEEYFVGKRYLDIIVPDDRRAEEFDHLVSLVREQPPLAPFDTLDLRSDGSFMSVYYRIDYTRDENQQLTGFIVCCDDITERLQVEAEAIKTEKLQSIGILAGGIAHDFNNLLAGVIGNISLACDETDPDTITELLDEATTIALRASKLTKKLLTFSEGGSPIMRLADISAVVRESANIAAEHSSARLEFYLPENLDKVRIDTEQMAEVIQNLVVNSCNAMPKGGKITFEASNITIDRGMPLTTPAKKCVKLVVTDEGVGIAPEHIDKIFEPYFTTRQDIGHGLGLAIADSIVTKHGGRMKVESEPDKGAIFCILLPALPDTIHASGSVSIEDLSEWENCGDRKTRVLLMEPDD
ncbi:MAG: PAS domain S-box protein, partial [Candidatus Zixiibacteriota bacterium]